MCTFALSKGNDGIWAQGTKNLLSGLAKFTACPERKKRSREWRRKRTKTKTKNKNKIINKQN
jgi:hypothetical protein